MSYCDIKKLPCSFTTLSRTVDGTPRTFEPVRPIVRPIREKISRDVPSPLRRMANASDQIASAMETKNQATLPIADQLARLAKHHSALESDLARAIANGNQRKVDALSDKMERNRSYVQDLIDTLNDGQHSLVCFIDKDRTSYVAGYAAMPVGKPVKNAVKVPQISTKPMTATATHYPKVKSGRRVLGGKAIKGRAVKSDAELEAFRLSLK